MLRAERNVHLPPQLRNLLWATSKHDVYVVLENRVNHWSALSRETTTVSLTLNPEPMLPFPPIPFVCQHCHMQSWQVLRCCWTYSGKAFYANYDPARLSPVLHPLTRSRQSRLAMRVVPVHLAGGAGKSAPLFAYHARNAALCAWRNTSQHQWT